jgi:hypothetical protein
VGPNTALWKRSSKILTAVSCLTLLRLGSEAVSRKMTCWTCKEGASPYPVTVYSRRLTLKETDQWGEVYLPILNRLY